MDPLKILAMPERFRRPVMIMAFTGWNDAAEAATTAARYLAAALGADKFAEIDPEEFYHFGLTRPYVRFKAGSTTEREVIWPATEFSIAQPADLEREWVTDGELTPDELNLDNAAALGDAVWGQGFPEPRFHGHFEVAAQRIVGERHLKLRLRRGAQESEQEAKKPAETLMTVPHRSHAFPSLLAECPRSTSRFN